MTNEDYTTLILDKLGWDYEKELNPNRYSNTSALYAGDLILAILTTGTIAKAAKFLNTNYKKLYNNCVVNFVPIFGNLHGGGETWKFKLLQYIEYKKCTSCQEVLPYNNFGIDNNSSDGLYSCCKICRISKNAKSYLKPTTQEAHKKSQEKHYFEILARNAEYRAERKKRIPCWYPEQKEIIRLFYRSRPKDSVIDHILPLKGELVSGLHVIQNLQYLTPEENLIKSNKYTIE